MQQNSNPLESDRAEDRDPSDDSTLSKPDLDTSFTTDVAKFYEFESCGKCTPCREGTMRVLALLQNITMGNAKLEDIDTLQELSEIIRDTSFCGLGQTATHHVINALKFFRKDFEDKLK